MTSSSHIAQFQLTNAAIAIVMMPGSIPPLTNEKGSPRNPIPTTRLSMKKNPRKMLTVFGSLLCLLGKQGNKELKQSEKQSPMIVV